MSKLIAGSDYFIRYTNCPLPPHIGGFVTPNCDGTYSIYLDGTKPIEIQRKALAHEIQHLERDHFSVGVDPVEAEKELIQNDSQIAGWQKEKPPA